MLNSLVASSPQTRLEFRSGTTLSGGCCWGAALGDVSLTATTSAPEPASVVPYGTGLAGVAAMSRRRRRKGAPALEA